MEDILKIISLSLPIIFVVKNEGHSNLDELFSSLSGRGLEFRNLKSTDKFIRSNFRCFDYDGFNLKYNRFSDSFVKDEKINEAVKNFVGHCLQGYSNWQLYPERKLIN